MKTTHIQNHGFTIMELIVVLVVVAILIVVSAAKFVDLKNDAELNQIKSISGAFASAVKLVQLNFIKNGYSTRVQNLLGFGNGDVDTNNIGFPIGINKGNGNENIGIGNFGCQGVWDGILNTNYSATFSSGGDFQTYRHTSNRVCSYVWRKSGDTAGRLAARLVIQYDSRDGQVYTCGIHPSLSSCPF